MHYRVKEFEIIIADQFNLVFLSIRYLNCYYYNTYFEDTLSKGKIKYIKLPINH